MHLPHGERLTLARAPVNAAHAAGNYVQLSVQGRRHLLRATMADTEALLAALPGSAFVCIDRKLLVNLDAAPRPGAGPRPDQATA